MTAKTGSSQPLVCVLLRRAADEGYLSCLSLAVLFGMKERSAQRWLTGERTPDCGRDGLLWAALRLLSPAHRAVVFTWMIEATGGGCVVIDIETWQLVCALRAGPRPT